MRRPANRGSGAHADGSRKVTYMHIRILVFGYVACQIRCGISYTQSAPLSKPRTPQQPQWRQEKYFPVQTGKYFLPTTWKRSRLRCVDAIPCNETWVAARSGALASTGAFQGCGSIPHLNQPVLAQNWSC